MTKPKADSADKASKTKNDIIHSQKSKDGKVKSKNFNLFVEDDSLESSESEPEPQSDS